MSLLNLAANLIIKFCLNICNFHPYLEDCVIAVNDGGGWSGGPRKADALGVGRQLNGPFAADGVTGVEHSGG
jgi:hypothetical protein